MVFISFLVALVVALVMTAVFIWTFRTRRSWTGGLAFFVMVLLASWAGGIWVRPAEAVAASGAPWLPGFVVGFITSLFLSSFMPAWGSRLQTEGAVSTERRAPPRSLLTPAYWVALFVLLMAIIVR